MSSEPSPIHLLYAIQSNRLARDRNTQCQIAFKESCKCQTCHGKGYVLHKATKGLSYPECRYCKDCDYGQLLIKRWGSDVMGSIDDDVPF